MSRPVRIILWTFAIIVGLVCFVLVLPSLLGSLMGILLIFAIVDFTSRRYRNSVRNFNSALRAICHHDGAIEKVALAFSRSGPLSGPCYEYARRLMVGDDPLDAAIAARVPLQLQTAIAMQRPQQEADPVDHEERTENELALVDATMMPAYGQFIYLTITALVTCNVLAFMSIFILPTMEAMFDEFYGTELPYQWMFSTGPAVGILVLLTVIGIVIIPLLNRGHLLGVRLPRWIPTMPRLAVRKAEILNGLADGVEAGWPLGRTLALGHAVSTRSLERHSLYHAMHMIQQGIQPLEAMRRTGWIDHDEEAWLHGTPPQRAADLLRSIASQTIRDARSNLRWLMAVFFPVLILMLGSAVAAFSYGFFANLTKLISDLA